MTKIIGISGRKQSGKNTVANYINGDILKSKGLVEDFRLNENGQLEILTTNERGQQGWGIFDILRKDSDFVDYAENNIWPFIKVYHFADYLKQICIDLFDLKPEQVYGTDEDKNTFTPYIAEGTALKGKDALDNIHMTAREFLQYLGTDIMRKIKDTVWVDATINVINKEKPSLAIIPDVRFPNEVQAIQEAGGIVIRLSRDILNSNHKCEKSLDRHIFNWDRFDSVISNHDTDLKELCYQLTKIQQFWSE
jgi:hypothetical protein